MGKLSRVSFVMLAVLGLGMPLTSVAEIYRWQDENGNWHFSDAPKSESNKPAVIRSRSEQAPHGQNATITEGLASEASGKDLAALLKADVNPQNFVEEVTLSVVGIETAMGFGSGFFVSDQGLIVTNRHVIRPNNSDAAVKQQREFDLGSRKLSETEVLLNQEQRKLDEYAEELRVYKEDLDKRSGGDVSSAIWADYRVLEQRYSQSRAEYERVRANWRRQKSEFDRQFDDFKFKSSMAGAARQFKIVLKNDESYRAELVTISKEHDLALLRLRGYVTPSLTLLNGEQPRQGDRVYAVGSPLGLRDSVTAGIVTGMRERYLVTDAQILPGNSGGPLVDRQGSVIGVNTAKYAKDAEAEGFGFAIPLDTLLEEFSRYLPSSE